MALLQQQERRERVAADVEAVLDTARFDLARPGYSTFDTIKARGDAMTAERRRQNDGWWQASEMWKSPGNHHSETEYDAMTYIRRAAGSTDKDRRPDRKLVVIDVIVEVLREMRTEARINMTLKEILAQRGETLTFIDQGNGNGHSYAVPLHT